MAGHSKWAQIKRKKQKTDIARGKLFTRLIREITVAARQGGGDPMANARLRLAIQTAKDNNMPQDNIQRAIKKGTGEIEGVHFEEITYEGYGPKGVALLIETLTDNKNRTTSEVRHVLSKHNGNLGESGCVAWLFETKGVVWVSRKQVDEETLFEVAIEAGAEDVKEDEDGFQVMTSQSNFEAVCKSLRDSHVPYQNAEIQKIPKSIIKVEGDPAKQVLKIMESLEELDDVQRVSANFDIPDEILQQG
ncbi:MAG: YebC/PmpR family DNA-binding transcriptional regulator [Candidatus Latescibacteria bacterium]|nr:YebC/PmpR family DNA-binding transcriptional regulator [Candidatus Latescibacterota bacterium]NIM66511.1 YebC/PmpR family DNA-binding transcriptional regulator [Candidatus Latescibacterota bacterium]NIO02991.1 YebC/PmpR family DNA-binding transcriptional regulator [Candidatus Latescibacterota bacterium]NIO30126.1 YebC/PmpR family DNA-binding transcriptional regulator [Candidatus Latescibacterota bacterium]NIO57745.1 YebC/PmpR family DNA-binding transcriptional regulator [Candidatus Latesciba